MNLMELKELVDSNIEMCGEERAKQLVVGVANEKGGSFGGTPIIRIKGGGQGIDWNSGKFWLFTEVPVIEKPKDE